MSNTPFPESLRQEAILEGFLASDSYWTDVYLSEGVAEGCTVFAAFTTPAVREEVLQKPEWDSLIGDGKPGFALHSDGSVDYCRHSCYRDRALPIVITNDNHGIGAPIRPEIVEEFRHLMEFRPNSDHTEFHRLNRDGTLEPAAEVSERGVRIRTKFLRQYQAAKQLDLVLFIESSAWQRGDHIAGFESVYGADRYEIAGTEHRLRMWPVLHRRRRGDETVTVLMGKRIIAAPPQELAGMWPWHEHDAEQFQEFIIGEDELGRPVSHICDHRLLANDFGANPDAPNYRTPVWFRREVLQRYYADLDKYEVTDGRLSCGGLWSVRIDNDNSDGHVMVWLGDLGRDIPATERDHWKTHNVVLPKLASPAAIRRQLLGQWTDAESPVFVFKQEYRRFREAWREQFDWDLLSELEGPNELALDRLRTPLNDTDKEFEDQVKDLNLVLVEALNSKRLASLVTGDSHGLKSIALLERWLRDLGYPALDRDIGFLRTLQEVRSLSSHLRSRKHEERLRKLGVTDDRVTTMHRFFDNATTMLQALRSFAGGTEAD
ncbi:MAG: hypothetical protein F4190_02175 [Acidimicrobiales bacterium]|nr:hypothetical protein [Acidimicrobiales bacterium]MYI28061.1 hypothetical protein [Acidimicrobiales bacterium]